MGPKIQFSDNAIITGDKNGIKHWKKVEVKLQDHVKVPTFPQGKSPEFYDACFTDYLSNVAMDQLPLTKPLWEIHIVKYPTTTAAGNVVFKLHHALGDGYSLMGALLSCLQRADNPAVPLTFPAFNPNTEARRADVSVCGNLSRAVSGLINTVCDFGWSLLKSSVIEDDQTPVRSGADGVEFRPITISTLTFSIDEIKQVKASLGVAMNHELRNRQSTALVLLRTRNIAGYKSVAEMVEPDAESPWGTKDHQEEKELCCCDFNWKLLEALRKYRGPEVTAKYIHSTLKNTSMTISNIIGPVEQMALSNQPVKGLYFMVVGVPQSLTVTMLSYMGKLRLAVGTENGLIEAPKFKSCIQNAFDMILKAAVDHYSPTLNNNI
ncbi:hypothetical protein Sango_0000700 [Sesamum angolense]|uniref:Diacylglycerol O-acyltransferase n=1 Tax=Sesamum angolense TaxID=2727404 RepID=A0AAE2C4Y3_9LAMI|nr:hypothetical protein Sango_0000700 [Sesamum angolense]